MRWRFDGEGGWEACSKFSDDGVSLVYRIHVCDDGSFDLSESSPGLVAKHGAFMTLDAARAFCAGNERDLEAEMAG